MGLNQSNQRPQTIDNSLLLSKSADREIKQIKSTTSRDATKLQFGSYKTKFEISED